VPIPTGSIASGGRNLVVWLWNARTQQRETESIIRHALRSSICRYDPYLPAVDAVAARIEQQMWQLAQQARGEVGRGKRIVEWGRRRMPYRRRIAGRSSFPVWRKQLEAWVAGAADAAGYTGAGLGCRNAPADARTLAESFPDMFDLELRSELRISAFREELKQELHGMAEREASGADRHYGATSAWVGGALGAAAVAVGLSAAELSHWSSEVFLAIAGSATFGAVLAALMSARSVQSLTGEQREARALVWLWIVSYLSAITGSKRDRDPLVILQEAIEQESAERHAAGVRSERPKGDPMEIDRLVEVLGATLIPKVDAAGESLLSEALRGLHVALTQAPRGPCESDSVLPALHRSLAAHALAPAGRSTGAR